MELVKEEPPKPKINSRYLFAGLLLFLFCLGLFFKQFDLFHYSSFVAVAFCGAVGLLVDYAWRIRHSIYAFIPLLLAFEIFGDLMRNGGIMFLQKEVYLIGAALYPAYFVIFTIQGLRNMQHRDRLFLGLKFVVLGLLSSGLIFYEYITYYPEVYNRAAPIFKLDFMAIFGWLLFIDWTTNWKKYPTLDIPKEITRWSTFVIAALYFIRIIFK